MSTDEFFNQQVATGPLVPGEYQPTESNNAMTMMQESSNGYHEQGQTMTPPSLPVPTNRKLIISYSRTVQVRQFEPSVVSATMEADLPVNSSLEQAIAVYENEMMLVKAAVLSQQNLPFELSENERMIQEVFGATTPVSQTAAAPSAVAPAAFPAPTVQPQEAGGFAPPPQAVPVGAIRRTKTPSPADDPYWDMLVANPSSFWDNREGKLNPASPDFKLKVDKGASPEEKREAKALWLNTCPDRHMAHFGVVA